MSNSDGFEAASELLKALSAPLRVRIVAVLATGPRFVKELVDATGVSQPLVSQHLRILRGAGVVRSYRRGKKIAYALTDERIASVVAEAVRCAGNV